MIVWMAEAPMVAGKQYSFKHTTKTVNGVIHTLRYQVDVDTLHRKNAATLELNAIGRCAVHLTEPIAYEGYRRNRATGAFILIDRLTNATVGAGMILDRELGEKRQDHWEDAPPSETLRGEPSNVSATERSARFGQTPVTVLLTGLTGAGKTTIAYALERRLFDAGRASIVLDGQNMRLGISKDLGFTSEERSENLRRSAEVAKLMNDAGLIAIGAFVAPSESVRQKAREVIGTERTLVVYLSCPVEICRQRDRDRHYEKADAGEIANFPGVSAPYEEPLAADLVLHTDRTTVDEAVARIVELLESRKILS
jgi:bifunctional enzyme CysN/CysC